MVGYHGGGCRRGNFYWWILADVVGEGDGAVVVGFCVASVVVGLGA